MNADIRKRIEALKREIVEIQQRNLKHSQTPQPNLMAFYNHRRRQERLQQIMEELRAMMES
ncbi:MAG TPA: hypothetical protein VF753_09095 [Terriglobales bacterium]